MVKKIIAREFLTVVSITVVFLGCYLVDIGYTFYKQTKFENELISVRSDLELHYNYSKLEKLFELFPEGIFNTAEEVQSVIENEGLEVFYDLIPAGKYNNLEEYLSTFSGLVAN
jgi:hypothetical protein